jgi:hypothetical protein
MDTVIRNVGEIDAHDRLALEHVLGQTLGENQQLVIRIVDVQGSMAADQAPAPHGSNGSPSLPDWCSVYEGLSADEVAALEKTVLERADLSRPAA